MLASSPGDQDDLYDSVLQELRRVCDKVAGVLGRRASTDSEVRIGMG